MIVDELDIQREAAAILLQQHGSVKKAIDFYKDKRQK
jgi:hypothetical protein